MYSIAMDSNGFFSWNGEWDERGESNRKYMYVYAVLKG